MLSKYFMVFRLIDICIHKNKCHRPVQRPLVKYEHTIGWADGQGIFQSGILKFQRLSSLYIIKATQAPVGSLEKVEESEN